MLKIEKLKKLILTKIIIQKQPPGVEKVLLEILKNSQKNTCKFIKKETLTQVFSYEFYEISKNTFFTEHLLVTDSDYFYSNLGRSKIYVNESVNRQSVLMVYLSTTIIFNLNHEMKHIIFPGTSRNLKKTFWLSTKCNTGDITG